MAFAPPFPRPFSATFDPRAAAAAAALWWLAGGAPAPVAVYQPMGAASQDASYVNLANPGTYDAAPGTAPSWDAAAGWTFNGTTQYLETGTMSPWDTTFNAALIFRFANASTADTRFIGGSANLCCGRNGNLRAYFSNGWNMPGAASASGVMAMADKQCYFDGLPDGTVTGVAANGSPVIGCYAGGGYNWLGSVLAAAFWADTSNHAVWMPAVSAALAAL